jgi:hypothetical protein
MEELLEPTEMDGGSSYYSYSQMADGETASEEEELVEREVKSATDLT